MILTHELIGIIIYILIIVFAIIFVIKDVRRQVKHERSIRCLIEESNKEKRQEEIDNQWNNLMRYSVEDWARIDKYTAEDWSKLEV